MGNVGLGDVMATMATPAQGLHWHQSQPGSFEAHRTQDEKETCFFSQEHSDTSKRGLPSAHSKLSPFHPQLMEQVQNTSPSETWNGLLWLQEVAGVNSQWDEV